MVDFSDIDRDGMPDMLFYRDSAVYTFFNKYSSNSASDTNLCRTALETSVLAASPMFTKFAQSATDPQHVIKQTIYFGTEKVVSLVEGGLGVPGRLHVADIDADGYPDLLLTGMVTRDQKEISQSALFMNSQPQISSDVPIKPNGISKDSKREFVEQTSDYSLKDLALTSSSVGHFVDIDDDGRIDMLLQRKTSEHTDLLCIYNNYVKDAFFLKALMVNTLDEYGNGLTGANYRIIVTDLNDQKFVVTGSQLTQNSYNSLQMPYAYLGVGRSNNYVETFTAAYSIQGERSIRVWTPIIPNSQLIIFAPEMDT